MEAEKFKLSKRTIHYKCGCVREIFGFEDVSPSDKCEKHGEGIVGEENMVDEI